MRVFITGGTGYVGSAIVKALVGAGHEVTGLARSEKGAAQLAALGAVAVRGELANAAAWRDAAAASDTLVHAAVDYGDSRVASDRAVLEALIAVAAAGRGPRGVIYTSGVWVLGNTGDAPADEDASTRRAAPLVAWRPAHERRALDAAGESLGAAVIRPGLVFGGKGGTIAGFFASAEKDGAVGVVGGGRNRWSLVHCDDVAALYVLVAEKRARGVFHAVDGEPVRVADAARAASEAAGRGGAVRAIPIEEARKTMGPVADALCLDQVVAARRSLELGWKPAHAPFVRSAREVYAEWKAAS